MLVVGRDVSRLSSRANVLTQAGYTVDIFLTIDQAVRRILAKRYHLAVVSPTFPIDEQTAVRVSLKQVQRELAVLLLRPDLDSTDVFLAAVAASLRRKKTLPSAITRDLNPQVKCRLTE
jgi:DNA-binding response OmpR family regulator